MIVELVAHLLLCVVARRQWVFIKVCVDGVVKLSKNISRRECGQGHVVETIFQSSFLQHLTKFSSQPVRSHLRFVVIVASSFLDF